MLFRLSVLCGAVLFLPVAALAASPDFSDPAFAQAVAVVVATDDLAAHCPDAGQSTTAAGQAWAKWQADNAAEAVRRAADQAAAEEPARSNYARLKDGVEAKLSPIYAMGCAALTAWIGSEDARVDAAVKAQLDAPVAVARTKTPKAAPAAAKPAVTGILGYGLTQSYGVGYGGMIIVKFEPAVLFTSGEILLDVTGLNDLHGDRAAHPGDWSHWRKASGAYEYESEPGTWKPILNNQVWTTPPSAAGLQGRFTATGGGGNTALGGTSAVFVETSYTFLSGGRVVRDGVASSTAEAGDVGTVAGSHSGRQGRYTIDGLNMKIVYEDGSQESLILMTHPTDKDIIWIDGTAYTRD
ncbi:MAG: hypothetical protein JF615_09440 [Asticcacaulis sp.]|nr:hypothetical protein [Asticcacaulis sp.]